MGEIEIWVILYVGSRGDRIKWRVRRKEHLKFIVIGRGICGDGGRRRCLGKWVAVRVGGGAGPLAPPAQAPRRLGKLRGNKGSGPGRRAGQLPGLRAQSGHGRATHLRCHIARAGQSYET